MKNGNLQKTTELLAPAKDKETAFSAIDCGADAVYMGAPAFGARKNASNSLEDIQEVVNYAHKFWARVHITLNTILTDSELDAAVDMVYKLAEIGVDAIIIQDMGLLERLMSKSAPTPTLPYGEGSVKPLDKHLHLPPLHMSTQCDNYLPEKVKFFNDIGVSRVILARELSIEQIKKIHEGNPDLELESFIHGALCVSMSGQCYLSQYIGGRSANRGECAQPCRKQYDVIDEKGNVIAKDIYPLCLKDFNGSKYVNELINAGICSFKIEGRLKDTGYVKNIVAYYRNLLGKGSSSGSIAGKSADREGEVVRRTEGDAWSYPFTPNPEKSFNRGFTEYFLKKRSKCFSMESPKSKGEYLGKIIEVNKGCFVIETDTEIHPQDGLYFNNDGCLVNKVVVEDLSIRDSAHALTLHRGEGIKIFPNKKVNISIGDEVYRNLDVEFEKELAKPVKRQIGAFVTLNLFQGLAKKCEEIQDSKMLKQVRHDRVVLKITDEDGVSISAEIPSTEIAKNPEKMKETFVKQFSKTGEGDFYIADIKIAHDVEIPFIPISGVNELRRTLFDKLMQKRIEVYEGNRQYQKPLKHTKYFLSEVDYRANVHNLEAKTFYENCGVKVLESSFETKQPNRQIELMRCKHCIKYALNMCKSHKNLLLRDSHSQIYSLKFNCDTCEMSVQIPD